MSLGGQLDDGEKVKKAMSEMLLFEMANDALVAFLKGYRWLESEYKYPNRPADAELQIEFLEKQQHGIMSWLVIAPQRKVSFGAPLQIDSVGDFNVKNRQRVSGRGFKVFGEGPHRAVAEFLVSLDQRGKLKLMSPNSETISLCNKHRGIVLLYPVREQENQKVSIGYELLFPDNKLGFDLNFTVRRKDESDRVVVKNASK